MPAKRAKKKTKKPATRKAPARKSKRGSSGFIKKAFMAATLIAIVAVVAITAVYSFGSMDTRSRMEGVAIATVGNIRSQTWLPGPVERMADGIHDRLPGSEGYSVDAGELVREDSHFIAGQPRVNHPVQLLRNRSYFNLYSLANKQTACVAMRFINKKPEAASLKVPFILDPRIKNVRPRDMKLGEWGANNVAPLIPLTRQHGELATQEANLHTNLAPMTESFSQGVWKEATQLLGVRYPQRFEEVWLYIGPVYDSDGAKLASGVSVPTAFFAIAFDFTEAGGLRALGLMIPADATDTDLRKYLTTIDKIEAATGMIFMPALEPHVRDSLAGWGNKSLW